MKKRIIFAVFALAMALHAQVSVQAGGQMVVNAPAATPPTIEATSNPLVGDGSGNAVAGGATATELSRLSGVTSNVQAQLDGKAASNASMTVDNVPCALGAACITDTYIPDYTIATLPGAPADGRLIRVTNTLDGSSCTGSTGTKAVFCRYDVIDGWQVVSSGGTISVTNSPLRGDNAGNAVAAAYTDLVALWEAGSCSGYLKNDGTCGTPSGINPGACFAPALGLVDDGTTDQASALTTAESSCPAGIIFTANTGSGYYINTNHTITVPVWMMGGFFKTNTGVTTTLPTEFHAGRTNVLQGAGSYVLGYNTEPVYPEWWGVVADSDGAGSGTDNTTNLQKVATAMAAANSGTLHFKGGQTPYGGVATYKVNGQITWLGRDYSAVCDGPLVDIFQASCVIMNSSTTATTFKVGDGGTTTTKRLQFKGLWLGRAGNPAPTGTLKGFHADGVSNLQLSYMESTDNIYNFYFRNCTNCEVERSNAWNSSGAAGLVVYGYTIDTTGGVPSPSFKIVDSFAGTDDADPDMWAIYINGTQANDVFVERFESARAEYHAYINVTGIGAGYSAADMHFWSNIADTCRRSCFYITGATSARASTIEITGSWLSASQTYPVVDIESSSGVVVSGNQFSHNGSSTNGVVYVNGGGGNVFTDNVFLYSTYDHPFKFNSTSFNRVANNVAENATAGAQTFGVLTGSTYNSFGGNVIKGANITTGYSLDSTSNNNVFGDDDVFASTVTTKYSVNASATGNKIPIAPVHFTTAAVTSETVSVPGMTAGGHCVFSATNSTGASDIANVWLNGYTSNQITINHSAVAFGGYDILCKSY